MKKFDLLAKPDERILEMDLDRMYVLCSIDDQSTNSSSQKELTKLAASSTVKELVSEAKKLFHHKDDSFSLSLLKRDVNKWVKINDQEDLEKTLREAGFACDNVSVNQVVLHLTQEDETCPTLSTSSNEQATDNLSKPTQERWTSASLGPPPYSSNASSCFTTTAVIEASDQGLVGLVNQAMTCYLNSLLQTLYMTPEFRNALYRWEFDGDQEEGTKSIPFQLQKLFLQLQTSKSSAIGTTELTKSFGWDSSEAWQQHDVQELCRVMFDALEQKFKNTDQADLISRLYEGKLKDYVKCLECSYESAREDTFLDIPLVVRPFGSSESYGSVEEAIQAFVTPETLEASNQYFCEKCNKKCDAHKGLKFTRFPYLLTMQLKRFDFDPVTMHRIKLNDKVTFPEFLNLNEFMKAEAEESNDDADTTDSGSAFDDDGGCYHGNSKASPSICSDTISDEMEHDEGIDVGPNGQGSDFNEKTLRKCMEKGPYIYELFSIMVHSGSANGGHYYAYIKSFKDGNWYCFNDAHVSRITYDDIRKTYGGGHGRGYYSSSYSSSTNAYMLMYRQIHKERNSEPMSQEEFPNHIQQLLRVLEEKEEKERQERELEKAMCKIKLFCHHPIKKRLVEMKMRIHKDCTLAEATDTAYRILDLEDVVSRSQCRLVRYDQFHDSLECSFEDADDNTLEEVLDGVRNNYKSELLLEIRKPNKEFLVYRPGGSTVKVHTVDIANGEVSLPVTVRGHLNQTVEEFKNLISQALELHINPSQMRIALEKYCNDIQLLESPQKTLKAEGFQRSNKVFIEYKDDADSNLPFHKSEFFRLSNQHGHTICMTISLPKLDKESLGSLGIPVNFESQVRNLKADVVANDDTGFPDKGGGVHPECTKNRVYDEPSDCDEGVESLLGDASSVGCCAAVNSDQSEDSSLSSLTDSERTLVGDELSPRNNSPDLNDLVDNCPGSPPQLGSESADWHQGAFNTGRRNASTVQSHWEEENEDTDVAAAGDSTNDFKHYFRAWAFTDTETSLKSLKVYLDKRITFGALKKELEQWVGLASDFFKLYGYYSNNQEYECTRMSDNLMCYSDGSKLTVKLGRALQKGEYRVKIYQILVNDPEPCRFLIDAIFAQGMTVLQAKKDILPKIREQCQLDIPLNRCRMRRKNWKNPGQIFLDSQKFDEDIPIFPSWEVFIEILPEAEQVLSKCQLSLLTRHWHPSTYKMDPFKEVILEEQSCVHLQKKISEISDIPPENLEYAKGQGTFPCEVSVLTVHVDLEWNSNVNCLNMWPLYISEDGHVIFYRDKEEPLKELSEEEKRELSISETIKYNNIPKVTCSPRKERALKIYMDNSPRHSSNKATSTETTATASLQ